MSDLGPSPTPVPLRHRGGPELRRMVKYGIVGVVNAGIDFGSYAVLVALGVWYPVAKVIALTLSCLNGYTWNRRWTFRAGAHDHALLGRYVLVQTTALVFNLVTLVLLVEVGGLGEVVAQAVAAPGVILVGFLGQRHWTFTAHVD